MNRLQRIWFRMFKYKNLKKLESRIEKGKLSYREAVLFLDDEGRSNAEFMLNAAKADSECLEFASAKLRDDYGFMLNAVKDDVLNLGYASSRLKTSPKFMQAVVKTDCIVKSLGTTISPLQETYKVGTDTHRLLSSQQMGSLLANKEFMESIQKLDTTGLAAVSEEYKTAKSNLAALEKASDAVLGILISKDISLAHKISETRLKEVIQSDYSIVENFKDLTDKKLIDIVLSITPKTKIVEGKEVSLLSHVPIEYYKDQYFVLRSMEAMGTASTGLDAAASKTAREAILNNTTDELKNTQVVKDTAAAWNQSFGTVAGSTEVIINKAKFNIVKINGSEYAIVSADSKVCVGKVDTDAPTASQVRKAIVSYVAEDTSVLEYVPAEVIASRVKVGKEANGTPIYKHFIDEVAEKLKANVMAEAKKVDESKLAPKEKAEKRSELVRSFKDSLVTANAIGKEKLKEIEKDPKTAFTKELDKVTKSPDVKSATRDRKKAEVEAGA